MDFSLMQSSIINPAFKPFPLAIHLFCHSRICPNLLSSKYIQKSGKTQLLGKYPYNLNDNLYLFLKINNWGNIQFLNQQFFAKILFNSYSTSNKIDEYVNNPYVFRQPINIQILDIELVDYLGNNIDLNGRDFSFTIKLVQILNTEQKCNIEKTNLFFIDNKKS